MGEPGLLRSVPFPVNKGEGSFRFAHVRLGERHHLRTGKEESNPPVGCQHIFRLRSGLSSLD